MTTTIGYNQCDTTIVMNNYQESNHLNIDLNLVKSEPLDSPTSSSSSSSSSSTSSLSLSNYHLPQQLNTYQYIQQQQIQQQPSPLPQQTSGSNQQLKNHISHINHIKMNQLSKSHYNLPQKQQLATKYRKNKNNLHNLKSYQHSNDNLGKIKQPTIKKLNQTPSNARRNERERNRVKNLNQGFQKLRSHIPNTEKKMSKVEALRSAVTYIKQLECLLNEPMTSTSSSNHFPSELLFSILNQHNQASCLSNDSEASNNSSNTNAQLLDQQNDQSSLDYFDLAELLS